MRTGVRLGAQLHRGDRAQRLEDYRAAREEGMDPYAAGRHIGIADSTREAYERWYRKVTGLPARERRIPEGQHGYTGRAG